MKRTLLLGAVLCLFGAGAAAQDVQAGHDEAIAAIRKLGGEVKVNAGRPGSPVTVTLTGTRNPTECLPYLERINNLHACDL